MFDFDDIDELDSSLHSQGADSTQIAFDVDRPDANITEVSELDSSLPTDLKEADSTSNVFDCNKPEAGIAEVSEQIGVRKAATGDHEIFGDRMMKISGVFDFDELDSSLPTDVKEVDPTSAMLDFDKLAASVADASEKIVVRNVRAHAVSAAAHIVVLDQEGQRASEEALRQLSVQFMATGWAYTSQLGVPPQCLSQVQLEILQLQTCKKTMRKAGGQWTQEQSRNKAYHLNKANVPTLQMTLRKQLFIDFPNVPTLRKHFRGLAKLDQIVERVIRQFSAVVGTNSAELLMRGRTKLMLERYQPGGYYKPRLDVDEEEDETVLTAIYYLNTEWGPEDGGALRLWSQSGSAHAEIWPKEDTFVVFRSDQVTQEVCVSQKKRFALIICFTGSFGDACCDDTSRSLAGVAPMRKLPAFIAERSSETSDMQMYHLSRGWSSADARQNLTDSDSEQSDESDGSVKMPLLVCFNIVGFTREQGIQKFAGLFVEAAKLGIKDNIVLSYPEDHGIEGASEPWSRYVDALVNEIEKKARSPAQPLIVFAHSLATASALTLASRLDTRILKIYTVDGCAPHPTNPSGNNWAESTAYFRSLTDADWIRFLVCHNPGSSVLREMAAALETGSWDVTKSRGAQDLIKHGQRQYVNRICPDVKRDMKKISAPILVFFMTKDDVFTLDQVQFFEHWTMGGLQIVKVDNFHMGWLEPTQYLQTSVRRVRVFDRICEDISKHLQNWISQAPGDEGESYSPSCSVDVSSISRGGFLGPEVLQHSDAPAALEATPANDAIERCLQPGERCSGNISDLLRIRCTDFARGCLKLDVCVRSQLKEDLGLVLFAFPGNKADDFRWVSQMSPAGAVGWQCCIQTHRWSFTSPYIIVLPLLMSEAPRPSEDALLFTGLEFRPLFESLEPQYPEHTTVSNAVSFQASLIFCPEEESMPSAELRLAHSVFYKAFNDIDGVKLSADGKETLGRDGDGQLNYGEVQFFAFWDVMNQYAKPRSGETFIDLGSGTGRAVIAMALGFPELQQSVGLELLAPLHAAAERAVAALGKTKCPSSAIDLQQVNFLEVDWETDADIIWVSSLCMDEDTLNAIAKRTKKLKKGSRIFTMDSSFADRVEGLEKMLLDGKDSVAVEMSFGEGRIYAARRT